MKTMKTTQQALLILDNNEQFRKTFATFKEIVTKHINTGFTYNGRDIEIKSFLDNGTPNRIVCPDGFGHTMTFRNGLPMDLFNAGYRLQQFGLLFTAANFLSFSQGETLICALQDKATGAIRKEVGYNEQKSYNIELAVLALLGRIIKPAVDIHNV